MEHKPPLNRALEWILDNVKDVVQSDIAEAIGVKQSYISNLKNGKKNGPVETWQKITDYFDLPYDSFFSFGELMLKNEGPKYKTKPRKADLKKVIAEWGLEIGKNKFLEFMPKTLKTVGNDPREKATEMLDRVLNKLDATVEKVQKEALLILAEGQIQKCREKADERAERNLEKIVTSVLSWEPIEDEED